MIGKNLYLDGMMGLVIGDALGCPVEFVNREELQASPVTDMEEYGTFNMPKGTWTDDSSLAIATLDALRYGYEVKRIQDNFAKWLFEGKYTPAGITFDVGVTCEKAISAYATLIEAGAPQITGLQDEYSNGNGSLMRILPMCIYMTNQQEEFDVDDDTAVKIIHEVSSVTHAHIRSKMACGIYYFIVREIINTDGPLNDRMQRGIDKAVMFYQLDVDSEHELGKFERITSIETLRSLSEDDIKSSGYVVDSIEAALWALVQTDTLKDALLKAVNLGDDTDSIAAIAGGLAGLYYGYEAIPYDWLNVLQRREWVEKKCLDLHKSDKQKVDLRGGN